MKITTRPVTREFSLNYVPPGESAPLESDRPMVIIRQATTGDNRKLADFVAEATYGFDDAGQVDTVTQKINGEMLKRARTFLTLCGDKNLFDEHENPLFEYAPSSGVARLRDENQFNRAWDALPPELTDEIYDNVLRVNPQWGQPKGE